MDVQTVVDKFKAGGYDGKADGGAITNPNPTNNGQQLNSKDKGDAPLLYEVKVNGQDKKFTLDELKSRASKSDAADENFRKAAEMEKSSKERASKWNEWWASKKDDYPDQVQ